MALASANQVLRLLREQSHQILSTLKMPRAQLSMPTDGRGVRILVGIDRRAAGGPPVPQRLQMNLDGELVDVPIEIDPVYQDYQAY